MLKSLITLQVKAFQINWNTLRNCFNLNKWLKFQEKWFWVFSWLYYSPSARVVLWVFFKPTQFWTRVLSYLLSLFVFKTVFLWYHQTIMSQYFLLWSLFIFYIKRKYIIAVLQAFLQCIQNISNLLTHETQAIWT